MGGLETGVNKNIAETQQNLDKSSADYQSQLKNINNENQYQGVQDLQNVNDSGTFSRLNYLLNPTNTQSKLAGVKSNTANYRPDTQGVAQASDMGGLSSQLQKQYGTSAGGSRLDALLYRGGGNAGKAINQGLSDISKFNDKQQSMLGAESNLLNQFNQGAASNAQKIRQEGSAFQNQLKANAGTAAQQAQQAYDAKRAQDLSAAQNIINNTDYRNQINQALNSVYSNNEAADSRFGGRPSDQQKADLYNSLISQIDMKQFDPNKYLGEARTFNQNAYLDPRFNTLGQLLGTEQIASASAPSTDYQGNSAKLQSDIQAYLDSQILQGKNAAEALYKPTVTDNSTPKGVLNDESRNILALLNPVTGLPWLAANATGPGRQALSLGSDVLNKGSNGFSNIASKIGGSFGF